MEDSGLGVIGLEMLVKIRWIIGHALSIVM